MLNLERLDLDTAKQVICLLEHENQRLHERLAQQTQELAALRQQDGAAQLALELSRLKEQVAELRHQHYGTRSEKRPSSPDERCQDGAPAPDARPARPRRGHGPTRQPRLPVLERTITLPEDERACDVCGAALEDWKGQFETSELVNVVRRTFVIETVKRQKYRCRCHSKVACAPAPLKLFPGGRYSLELAVEVAVDKFLDNIPLHRQVARMRREGLYVTSQALYDQTAGLAMLLVYCHDALGDRVLSSRVVHIDETTWRLLKPSARWYLWCVSSSEGAYYRLSPSRSSQTALEMLEGYDGVVVADGYKVYESLARKPSTPFRLAFCWAHVRRALIKAERAYPQCTEAIDLIRELYAIEREVPRLAADAAEDVRTWAEKERARLRADRSRPISDRLKEWAFAQRGLPGSSLRKATDYMLTLWPGLTAFIDDPCIPLDNNHVERQLRGPVIGRKNYLGSRSADGARVTEILYTLVHSAMLVGVDPRDYLLAAAQRALEQPGAVLLPHELKGTDP